jgi:hypothetical protein
MMKLPVRRRDRASAPHVSTRVGARRSRAAVAVRLSDLGDGGHVDGVVDPAVPAPAQAVDLAAAGGDLDRRGAVAGGEVVAVAEAGHVADLGDDGGGDDRADPDPRLCAAIVDRLTFGGNILETGTDSYRLAQTRPAPHA